jgi:hypothetical protein
MICPKDFHPCTGVGLLSRQECIERCRAEAGLRDDQSALAPRVTIDLTSPPKGWRARRRARRQARVYEQVERQVNCQHEFERVPTEHGVPGPFLRCKHCPAEGVDVGWMG